MRVPRKNISTKMRDISSPVRRKRVSEDPLKIFVPRVLIAPRRPSMRGKAVAVIFLVVFSSTLFFTYSFYRSRADIFKSLSENWKHFQSSAPVNFSPEPGANTSGSAVSFWSFLKDPSETFSGIKNISAGILGLSDDISFLEGSGFDLALNKKGEDLISALKKTKDDLSLIKGGLNGAGSADFLSLNLEIGRLQNFLDVFVSWLDSADIRHVLVLLQNPSEMRPAGGFLGSYADIAVRKGSIESVDVHDINDIDRQSDLKIIPPFPLQAIITGWHAADANWFFDFPSSARKVLEFAESSRLYKDRETTFDAAVAVSPKIIGDLLTLTGPVKIPENKTAFDKDNFLVELQRKVQAGQSARATYPKKVLEELMSAIVSAISQNSASGEKSISGLVYDWFSKKDLMVYFKDENIQKFFDVYAFGGRVFELPQNFNGDYLAIVNANVGGGKTDLFVKQKIVLQSQINLDGTISDNLIVSREHFGGASPYWWYRLPNVDYLKIFVPPAAEIVNFNGGLAKKIYPKINYKSASYKEDSLIAQIEGTAKNYLSYPALQSFRESEKEVFASWVKTDAGEVGKISFYYKSRLSSPIESGAPYQFVFEKQAGLPAQAGGQGDYTFEISAPVGYKWKENGLPVFEYQTSDPPGRLNINLTLEK